MSSLVVIPKTLLLIMLFNLLASVQILRLVTIGQSEIVGDQLGARKDTSESREPVPASSVESIRVPKMAVDVMVDPQK